jgi:hypothetical protein
MPQTQPQPQKNIFRTWFDNATTQERLKLAELSGTTPGTLDQIRGGYRTDGTLSASPEMACKIEKASIILQREGLPPLPREDLCPVCGACDLARVARQVV